MSVHLSTMYIFFFFFSQLNAFPQSLLLKFKHFSKKSAPQELDLDILKLGQEKFQIFFMYCALHNYRNKMLNVKGKMYKNQINCHCMHNSPSLHHKRMHILTHTQLHKSYVAKWFVCFFKPKHQQQKT